VPKLHAVYYRASDGSEPVYQFIDRLSAKKQAVLDNQIDRLNMLTSSNPHLPFPHSSKSMASSVSCVVTMGPSSTGCSIAGRET
jgi:hypothetical protein